VVAVRKGASVKEMAARLRQYRVSAFPVIDGNRRVTGVVSEADLPAKEALADHAARPNPLTDTEADTLIHSARSAPLLLGYRGSPPADLGAVRDLLLRVSRLADDLPEVTDLDLNPVIARPDGTYVVDARIKVTPYQPQDPFLRNLR
jgi:CBS domain-containing protein